MLTQLPASLDVDSERRRERRMFHGTHSDGRRRAGNRSFGCGWYLAGPSGTQKRNKALLRHRGADDSDAFSLSGVEDLVLALRPNGEAGARDIAPAMLAGPPRRCRPTGCTV